MRGGCGVGLIGVHTVFVGHSSAGQILSCCATVGAMGRDSFKLLLSIAPMASQEIKMCSGEGWPTEAVCTQIIHQCKPHNKKKTLLPILILQLGHMPCLGGFFVEGGLWGWPYWGAHCLCGPLLSWADFKTLCNSGCNGKE